ncbi:hypothetical protein PRIPAC_81937 [Pristionchus pacificus]|uniref:Uncharacterized protein n=1 Tax=Pristionchus pacificus TaxID=54126 RepID=A0A2A6BWK6_PRIPA|nr:hypothetical protein PRIPAC_81937 [Pristionchus pacificus]|eukprot:PDM70382.1 hypothetical protein PRIPAC_46628 [Pristionchus pacificus]
MGFQVGIKYSTPAPFPQVGIKQAYVPAVSSTHVAYKSCSDCLRARARLTICGPQLGRLLNVTVPTWSYHVRPLVTVWGNPCSPSINMEEATASEWIRHLHRCSVAFPSSLHPNSKDYLANSCGWFIDHEAVFELRVEYSVTVRAVANSSILTSLAYCMDQKICAAWFNSGGITH